MCEMCTEEGEGLGMGRRLTNSSIINIIQAQMQDFYELGLCVRMRDPGINFLFSGYGLSLWLASASKIFNAARLKATL